MNATQFFDIEWRDSGHSPQCDPNPLYPHGIDLDASKPGKPSCKVELPYPAPRIGYYLIECMLCGVKAACTTAGRVDDPKSMRINCNEPTGTH